MSSDDIYSQRLAQVREQLPEWEVDAVMITGQANRRWLSGFTGSNCTLVVTADKALLATDFRYWEAAVKQAPAFTLYKQRPGRDIGDLLEAAAAASVGIEARHVTLQQEKRYTEKAEEVSFTPLEGTVEKLRDRKDDEELACIRRAAFIADTAMAQVPRLVRPGLVEAELAWQLEVHMRENGAEAVAFDIIVASGPNAAIPHHATGQRQLQAGDALIVDLGARVQGYHSDLTRTFYLGAEPDETFWDIYNLTDRANKAALENMGPDMTGPEIDALARQIIADAGHGDHFEHALGHGVGLEIHEGPTLSSQSADEPIGAGGVVTVEPGVYVPGWGGVRIEDLVLLVNDGIEVLSQAAKNPVLPLT